MAASTLELPRAQLPDAPAPHGAVEQPWRPRINPWIVAMTVTLATFMEVLDSSIANVALPHIAGGLGATQDEATWVLTAYLVANAIILPAGAYMTTFIGRKKFYMICVALFGISSALCGLAPSLPPARLLPHPAGRRRRRPRPIRAGHPRRHLPARKARPGLRHVRPRRRLRPRHRPHPRRLHHRQLRLALDLLPQRPHLYPLALPHPRIVEDPPWVEKQVKESQKGGIKLDFLGFGLLALTFGSLEFVLDKGQEDDWFSSHLITFFVVAWSSPSSS